MNSPLFDLDLAMLLTTDMIVMVLFKFLFVVGALIYALFALLVIRQIQLMRSTVETSFSGILLLIGLAHFGLALLLVLYYLAI